MFSPQTVRNGRFTTAVVTLCEVQRKRCCSPADQWTVTYQPLQSFVVTGKGQQLHEVLRQGREAAGLTQTYVAEHILGKKQQSVGNYEAGTRIPRALDLGLLARAYRLDADLLQRLAKEARARRNASAHRLDPESSAADRMVVQLRMVLGALTEQVDELAEAVEFLKKERSRTVPKRRG